MWSCRERVERCTRQDIVDVYLAFDPDFHFFLWIGREGACIFFFLSHETFDSFHWMI